MVQRTQITLQPEQHRRARRRAAELGVSLASMGVGWSPHDLGEGRAAGDVSSILDLGDTGGSDVRHLRISTGRSDRQGPVSPEPVTLFVDSSVFYAGADRGDSSHTSAAALLKSESLVTTDHVLAETWLLLNARLGRPAAERSGRGSKRGGGSWNRLARATSNGLGRSARSSRSGLLAGGSNQLRGDAPTRRPSSRELRR
ncbi:MAG: hypothetical protein M5T61_21190 [Acidimicrobiia bacterium]|nr:hypothetical protein [Acidimicrobiia bacterium]